MKPALSAARPATRAAARTAAASALPEQHEPWFVRWPARSSRSTVLRLLTFSHAGGGPGAFREWPARLPEGTDLWAVRYPGRESRIAEPPAESVQGLASDIATAFAVAAGPGAGPDEPGTTPQGDAARRQPAPLVLVGHSLGALVAYETARVLRDAGAPPAALVVSALPAPELVRPPVAVHDLPEEPFLQRLRRYGATPPEVLGNRELLDLLLPTIRADFRLVDTYRHEPDRLPCPVLAVLPAADATVSRQDLIPWALRTAAGFELVTTEGGHFCPVEHPGEMVARILAGLAVLGIRPSPIGGPR